MTRNFTLDYWIDDDWYVGKIREILGIFSQGETLDDLIANIKDAYNLMAEENKTPVISYQSTEIQMEVI